jgi:hypothetical protein
MASECLRPAGIFGALARAFRALEGSVSGSVVRDTDSTVLILERDESATFSEPSVPVPTGNCTGASASVRSAFRAAEVPACGRLVINADDWGRDFETTTATFECVRRGTVSAVSGMVFMKDSERAAALAQEHSIDTGLHINFSSSFSAPNCPLSLVEHHRKVATYLLRHPLARVFFHPGLTRSFEYVVKSQIDEFQHLYGAEPERLDGHHHLHLSANVLVGGLLPPGTLVRRNFSFRRGEKSLLNRLYRKMVDRRLSSRHRIVDYLFGLQPVEPAGRLERIFSIARQSVVELEVHPVNPAEYRFLTKGEILRRLAGLRIAKGFGGATNSRGSQRSY